MQTDPTKTIAQISRLLSAFPPTGNPEPEETLRRYFEVLDEFSLWDIETAVDRYLRGKVPGFEGRFAPTPPMLAGQCRKALEERLVSEARRRPRLPAPEPEEVKDPKIAEGLRQLAKDLGAQMLTDEAKSGRKRHDLLARANAKFAPDMSPAALHRRLGWSVGDPDGDSDAA